MKIPYIYVGPTNKKLGLISKMLFDSKPLNIINLHKENFPLIEHLFISAEDFALNKNDLQHPESVLAKAYRQIQIS